MSQLIYKKMAQIIGDVDPISKDNTNSFHKFKFRSVDQVYTALNPLLAKHGVFFTPEVIDVNMRETESKDGKLQTGIILTIKYTFYAEDGSNVSCVVCGEALDTGDKATSKAMSIGLKYALFQTFCIPTEEESKNDPDNYVHDKYKSSAKQPTKDNAKQTQQTAPKQPSLTEQRKKLFETLANDGGSAIDSLAYVSTALNRPISSAEELTVQDISIIRAYYKDNKPVKKQDEISDLPWEN